LAAQISLGEQTVPQVPQYGSPAERSTHAERPETSHAVSGEVHVPVWQEELSHLSPAEQGVAVQEPQ